MVLYLKLAQAGYVFCAQNSTRTNPRATQRHTHVLIKEEMTMSKNIKIQVNFGNVSEYGYSAPSLNIDLPGAEPDDVDARTHNANMLASAATIVNDFTCAAADLGPTMGYDDFIDDDDDSDDDDDDDGGVDPSDLTLGQIFPDVSDDEPPAN